MVEIIGDPVEATEFGCNGVNPQEQSVAISDSTGTTDSNMTAVNSCISALEKFGFIAPN